MSIDAQLLTATAALASNIESANGKYCKHKSARDTNEYSHFRRFQQGQNKTIVLWSLCVLACPFELAVLSSVLDQSAGRGKKQEARGFRSLQFQVSIPEFGIEYVESRFAGVAIWPLLC